MVLHATGVTLCSMAGVDAPAASDAAILERLDDGAKQAAAGIGRPMLGLGSPCCSGSLPARVLGTGGLIVRLSGLTGGAALVAVTTRIAHQARALPSWAVWVSYVVAVLCLSGFWSAGMASIAFALWLIGAVIGLLRSSRAPQALSVAPANRPQARSS